MSNDEEFEELLRAEKRRKLLVREARLIVGVALVPTILSVTLGSTWSAMSDGLRSGSMVAAVVVTIAAVLIGSLYSEQ